MPQKQRVCLLLQTVSLPVKPAIITAIAAATTIVTTITTAPSSFPIYHTTITTSTKEVKENSCETVKKYIQADDIRKEDE